jgi:hypothetical protein
MENSQKTKKYSQGLLVLIVLAVLTGIEFILGSSGAASIFLWMTGLIKATLVVWFFMHIGRVFGSQTGGHE